MSSTILKTEKRFSPDNLRDYQWRAVAFAKEVEKCALWIDMGRGKTVSTLTAISELRREFEAEKILVIAPKRVIEMVWPVEVDKWTHTRDLQVTVLNGDAGRRARLIQQDKAPIHAIGRELIPWLIDTLAKWRMPWPYDMIVIDESSSFKSPSAKRFKKLRRVTPHACRVVELTGTPSPNGLLDLWSQIFLLDGGERLGKTFTAYKNKYFTSDYNQYNWELREGAKEKIYEAISDIVFVDDSPPQDVPIENDVFVELPAKYRKQYRELEREFILSLSEATNIVAQSAGVLTGKLLQFTSGAVYVGEDRETAIVHNLKLDAVEEIIDGVQGSPVLIAYQYRHELDRLRERFPQTVTLDEGNDVVERWNRGEIAILAVHPASAGHGLNLQFGGHNLIIMGLNWSYELYAQLVKRLARSGQKHTVTVHRIQMKDTVDERVTNSWREDAGTQSDLLNALRKDIEERLAA
ncbi:MAG: DEAD/DEAH box helicase [Pseudomonadota bacterium]